LRFTIKPGAKFPQTSPTVTGLASLRRAASLRLALFALLLFAVQPLLHAHPSAIFPLDHREGVHGPGPDFARAAVGEADFAPDPVVVAEGTRLDDSPAAAGTIATRRPDSTVTLASPALAAGLAPQPPPRFGAPRGPPR
jgi:hypothetical protein